MKKRILSMVLILALAISLVLMIPLTAQAATGSVKGVTATGSGYTRNRMTGVYSPNFTTKQAVTTDGAAIDNKVTSAPFYTTYSGGFVQNELKTTPLEGNTYYSKLTIECTDYDASAEAAYTNITIPGFVVEKVRTYYTDMGSKFVIIYSATMRSVYVGGVRVGNGTYLPVGATETQLEKPAEGGYAHLDGDELTLEDFAYTGSGDSHKAGIYAEFPMTIDLSGQNTFDMESGGTGIECTQALTIGSSLGRGTLTIYGDYGIVSNKNLTLQNGLYVIDTAKYECLYAGGDLTIIYPYLDLNCNDTTHGLAAVNAEGNITVEEDPTTYTLVSELPGGSLKAFDPAWELTWYKRIIRDELSSAVYVGGVLVSDGQYLAQGSTTPTTTKPADNYVHLKSGILTLHNFTLTNGGYRRYSNQAYMSQIVSATDRSYVLSLSGQNKLIVDESGELETIAIKVDDTVRIQQVSNGSSLDIQCNKTAIYMWATDLVFESGTVNIKSGSTAIDANAGSVHINGGALNIESDSYGIVVRGDCTVTGGSVYIRSKFCGIYGFQYNSHIRVTGGNVVVISDERALRSSGNIEITGGSLYLKADGVDYYDTVYAALDTDETCTIASGLTVKASTEHDGELGAYDPAKYKEYDFVVIGDPTVPKLDTCTVTFSPNSGTGTAFKKSDVIKDYYMTLPECPFQGTEGRTFTGWIVPGYNTLCAPGKSVAVTQDMEILAGWTDLVITEANATVDVPKLGSHPDMTPTADAGANYTVEVDYWYYYAGNGNYPHLTASDVFVPGTEYSLRLEFKPKAGYKFDSNTVFTVNGKKTTAYGMWGCREIDFYVGGYTVTVDPCGGTTNILAIQAYSDGTLGYLPDAEWTDDSMIFTGWYDAKTGGNKIDTGTVFTKDTTVYARYVKYCDYYDHSWDAATCTEPMTCCICGATQGSPDGHSWEAATCTEAKYCSLCGLTEGKANGHSWKSATCIAPKTCTTCGATDGGAKGHDWAGGTCTTPMTCKTCGATSGSELGHSWKAATCIKPKTCTSCGKTTGKPAGHIYSDGLDGTCNVCGIHRETTEKRNVMHMFRMYDPNSGEHFYTGSTVERENLVAAGWHYEGVGFTFSQTTGLPVYRLYDPVYGEHLYTMDEAEKAALMAAGWNLEGIAFNSAYDTEVPQYRLHNPNAKRGAYHFTASIEERDFLISLGWEYQGIGFYSSWK